MDADLVEGEESRRQAPFDKIKYEFDFIQIRAIITTSERFYISSHILHSYLVMSILRFSLPLLVVGLLANVLIHPLISNTDAILVKPDSNVLLLTAHPDDECMFFAPTILSLTKHHHLEHGDGEKKPLNVFSLALSVGDAEGLGDTRREELGRSLDVLGVGEGKRWVVDHPYVSLLNIFKIPGLTVMYV